MCLSLLMGDLITKAPRRPSNRIGAGVQERRVSQISNILALAPFLLEGREAIPIAMRGLPNGVCMQLHWHSLRNGSAAVVVPTCRCGCMESDRKGEPSSSSWAWLSRVMRELMLSEALPVAIERSHCFCEQKDEMQSRIPNEIDDIGSIRAE
jgi:hypothetical protein